ncbi:MAG: Ig-like domain-containing protein [Pseudomonadota bacterium]
MSESKLQLIKKHFKAYLGIIAIMTVLLFSFGVVGGRSCGNTFNKGGDGWGEDEPGLESTDGLNNVSITAGNYAKATVLVSYTLDQETSYQLIMEALSDTGESTSGESEEFTGSDSSSQVSVEFDSELAYGNYTFTAQLFAYNTGTGGQELITEASEYVQILENPFSLSITISIDNKVGATLEFSGATAEIEASVSIEQAPAVISDDEEIDISYDTENSKWIITLNNAINFVFAELLEECTAAGTCLEDIYTLCYDTEALSVNIVADRQDLTSSEEIIKRYYDGDSFEEAETCGSGLSCCNVQYEIPLSYRNVIISMEAAVGEATTPAVIRVASQYREARDVTAPYIESSSIEDGAESVSINIRPVLYFSEAMQADTIDTTTILLNKTPEIEGAEVESIEIELSYSESENSLTISPINELESDASYQILVLRMVRDTAGNPMDTAEIIRFSTTIEVEDARDDMAIDDEEEVEEETEIDDAEEDLPPREERAERVTEPEEEVDDALSIAMTNPIHGDPIDSLESKIVIQFNIPIDADSFFYESGNIDSSFILRKRGSQIPVDVELTQINGKTFSFLPSTSLDARASYIITVTTDVADLDGNYLPTEFSSIFTTP